MTTPDHTENTPNPDERAAGGITRRQFATEAGIATIAAADLMAAPAIAARRGRRRKRRQTVAVFGGGIAGLTTAHELIERGFDVTLYERRAWGGKARSTNIPGTARGGRKPLPGEHSFRYVGGMYKNLPDTLARIPFGSNPNGVSDNLVAASTLMLARIGKHNLSLPVSGLPRRAGPMSTAQVLDTVVGLALQADIAPAGAMHLAHRLAVFFSSCDARRIGQWDNVSWKDFVDSDQYGQDYERLLRGFFEMAWASRAQRASTKVCAKSTEWVIYNILGQNSKEPVFRNFDRPTNEAFIDPWIALLRNRGVHLRLHHELTGFVMRGAKIAGAHMKTPHGRRTVTADWYVCALPLDRARRLWNHAMIAADRRLGLMSNLDTAWGNGLKFFLSRPTPISNGLVLFTDSAWFIGATSQAQFWPFDLAATYGDGRVRDCISLVWLWWDEPGIVFGKPAAACTPAEIARECWEQMKQHFLPSEQPLTDDLLVSWNLDPGLIPQPGGGYVNEDVLSQPTVGAWPNRPDAGSAIPNFILAGDYVRGDFEMLNMEIANETGRRATNAILERSRSRETPVTVTLTYRPPEWEPLKRIDEQRYSRGQPNLFDVDALSPQLTELLGI